MLYYRSFSLIFIRLSIWDLLFSPSVWPPSDLDLFQLCSLFNVSINLSSIFDATFDKSFFIQNIVHISSSTATGGIDCFVLRSIVLASWYIDIIVETLTSDIGRRSPRTPYSSGSTSISTSGES
jgi:hypothetical protein